MEPIRFFLASSTEGLEDERTLFPLLIKGISKDKKIDFEPWTWEEERGRYTDPNNTIQSSINIELEKSSAVFFIFYNKIGEGVKEEFEKACELGIECYFYLKKSSISSDASEAEIDNWNELMKFINDLKKKNRTYYLVNYNGDKGLEEFKNQIRHDVELYIKKNHLHPDNATKSIPNAPVYDSRIIINSHYPINNHFVGRLGELNDLSRKICDNETIAVYGMGGMGKTSLIAQYCKTHESEYEKIVWVPYHNNLKDSILALGADYSYQHGGRQIGFSDIVSSLNSIEGRKLIVFDNFDIDRDEINEKYNEIKQCFPSFKKVFTTRTDLSILDDEICIFNLVELKREEAVELFIEYYRTDLNDEQVSFSQLSEFLDVVYSHTLIIELVAKLSTTTFL